MPTFKLLIEYEGTRYSGWQTQTNTSRTIQGHLQRAADELVGRASLGGAGRTDAGVHAVGQVAHLRTSRRIRPEELEWGLNERLPHDIHVLSAETAKEGFHARRDATARVYVYQISRRRSALAKSFVWWVKDRLDERRMTEAAALLEGKHDFAAFADKRAAGESTLVVVDRVEVGEAGDLILIRVAASHFLWKMVRKLVAALAEVGRKGMEKSEIESRLREGGPRFEPTAPPSGLFLESVHYRGMETGRRLEPIVPVGRPEGSWQRAKKH
ncbi:MAG TPA: tRNA pseudouridine(38-40) synthase TruA [Thermoanaerobaculia bacterium]|nr:tRNA pseudouridine(38-40) synthase TruA [Thermoanaerobaculia bacterium]